MRVALLTNIISPHQLPLARALVARLGAENYRYVYTERTHGERARMGWQAEAEEAWCRQGGGDAPALWEADVVYSGERAMSLFRRRNEEKKITFYVSERWFKPPLGFLRLLAPHYFLMAWRFVRCVGGEGFLCLPQGIHAARDFARLLGLFRGDVRCLFRAPKVAFESRPGGAVVALKDALRAGVLDDEAVRFAKKYGFVQIPEACWGRVKPQGVFAKLRMWGYFVAPGKGRGERGHALPIKHPPRALWVGRMLDLKRVGDLVRACRANPDLKRKGISLDLYGRGPEEARLRKLAAGAETIRFHDFVPVERVREVMRAHDVYVLPSNAYEGWGAVVSEALEEGMRVLATVDSGAGATLLPPSHLFKAGEVKRLSMLLCNDIAPVSIGPWTAKNAAEALLKLVEEMR